MARICVSAASAWGRTFFPRQNWRKRSKEKIICRSLDFANQVCLRGSAPCCVLLDSNVKRSFHQSLCGNLALRLLTIMQRWRQTVFGYWCITPPRDQWICQSALTKKKKRYRSALPLKAVDASSCCSGARISEPTYQIELNPIKFGFSF